MMTPKCNACSSALKLPAIVASSGFRLIFQEVELTRIALGNAYGR